MLPSAYGQKPIPPKTAFAKVSLRAIDPSPIGTSPNSQLLVVCRLEQTSPFTCLKLAMILFLASHAPLLQAQIGTTVALPPCSSGPEIYRNVARERDAGYAIQTQLHSPVNGATPEGHRRSITATNTHNRLVRQIYAHIDWTPDDVAERWLNKCKAYESRAVKDDHPVVVVTSLE